MDSKEAGAAPGRPEALTPDEQASKVGDLGRGSHEQTQGGEDGSTGEPRPGSEAPKAG